MITTGSRLFFGLSLAGLVLALAYGLASGGDPLGVITLGGTGGVGDHLGFTVLLALAGVSAFTGLVLVAFRDADPDALAAVAATDAVPAAEPPSSGSPWPAVAAFAVTLTALGLAVSSALFVIGLVLAGVVVIEWMVQAWSERATGDPEVNRSIRNRVMYPVEIPAIAVVVIALLVLAVSRVLLALPQAGSTVAAIVLASIILGVGALLATRPRVSASVLTAVLAVGAVAVLAGGVVAGAVGEREFEHEGGGHEGEPASAERGDTGDEEQRETGGAPSSGGGGSADEVDPGGADPDEADSDDDSGDGGSGSGGPAGEDEEQPASPGSGG